MTMFIIQSLILMAIAYILGCIAGNLLQRLFGTSERVAVPAPATADAPKLKPAPKTAPKPRSKPAKPRTRVVKAAPAAKLATMDDLKKIKGVGRQNEAKLNAIGIATYSQIAEWSAKEQRKMGERLAFPGRIEREEWVKQAKSLAQGGQTSFSKRVTSGEVSTSTGKGLAGDVGAKPPTTAKPRTGGGDNLTLIDGVGNALEKKLFGLGIHHFDQIAKWTKDHQAWVGNELGFPGRPERENWVAEAKILAKGGTKSKSKRAERGEIVIRRKTKIK